MENNTFENNFGFEPEVQQPAQEQPTNGGWQENVNEWTSNPVEKAKSIPAKLWIAIGVGIAAIVALILLLGSMGNSYKSPIQAVEKLLNTKSLEKIIDNAPSVLNGFGESEAKKIIKILKKSDVYKDAIEEAEESFDEAIEAIEENIGKNYKIKIEIEDKEKLDKDDCEDFEDQLKDLSKEALDALEESEEDEDFYEDGADELGISKSQAKEIVKQAKNFLKKCKKANVTAGYELELVVSIDGKELDEPQEIELTINVFKVSGKWIPDPFSLINSIGGMGMGALSGMF